MAEIRIESTDGAARRVTLDKERCTIGRSRENDIFLPVTGTLDPYPPAEKKSPRLVYDLGASFPDPAARAATIAYSLARAEEVDLAVFDPGGRLVRKLASVALSAIGPISMP